LYVREGSIFAAQNDSAASSQKQGEFFAMLPSSGRCERPDGFHNFSLIIAQTVSAKSFGR
jgi:hypothetical protein